MRPLESSSFLKDAQGTRNELKQFTNQVSDFFGNLIKEVKTTANELMNDSPPSPAGSPTKLFRKDAGDSLQNRMGNLSVEEREREEREKYELDLAIAMSLSEANDFEKEKNLLDIDSYTPMSTAPPNVRYSIDEEDIELKRTK